MLRTNFLCFVLSVCFFSCVEAPSDFDLIEKFVQTNYDGTTITDYDMIVALNAQGDCLNCNKAFAVEMEKYVNDNNVLFIISDHGAHIDISSYLAHQDNNNVLLDFKNQFADLEIIGKPAIILLDGRKVDTIIEINLKNLNENIKNFPSLLGESRGVFQAE